MASVLIIDDDRELCDMVVRLLSREGYSVEQRWDAERGLSAALSGKHDVVLLDIMMPGADGLQLLRDLRAKSQFTSSCLQRKGRKLTGSSAWSSELTTTLQSCDNSPTVCRFFIIRPNTILSTQLLVKVEEVR